MSGALVYALCGSGLIGVGLYGLITRVHLLRRILAFNVIGSGVFLIFGALGHRRPDLGADVVPQALIITGIVVALSLTALAVALVVKLAEESRQATLPDEGGSDAGGG